MQKDIASLIRRDSVHRSVYTDPEIFALEMERIFGRTWVYLGHDCEISQEGDYKTTTIGTHPVILSRLTDGSVTALLNRCRHRGATVCQHEVGNSRFFRCAYHAWTYSNDGTLVGVPMPAGYGPSFNREAHGLAKVPRVASYRGFIFGSMAEDGPTLERASRRRQETAGRLLRGLADRRDRGVPRLPEMRLQRQLEVPDRERRRPLSRRRAASQRGERGGDEDLQGRQRPRDRHGRPRCDRSLRLGPDARRCRPDRRFQPRPVP